MPEPIKWGWLPDREYDEQAKRELYGWRTSSGFFVPNEMARLHFTKLEERSKQKKPFSDYDEYWSSFGPFPENRSRVMAPYEDDTSRYAQRFREMFPGVPNRTRPKPPGEQPAQPQQPPQRQGPHPGGMAAQEEDAPVWSQADELELQRLQNGIASARSKAASGEWGEETSRSINEQLRGRLGQLTERKSKADMMAKAQARMQAMDEAAFGQSVMSRNAQATANDFMNTTAVFHDPHGTLPPRYFYQKRPGEFEEIASEQSQTEPKKVDWSGMED